MTGVESERGCIVVRVRYRIVVQIAIVVDIACISGIRSISSLSSQIPNLCQSSVFMSVESFNADRLFDIEALRASSIPLTIASVIAAFSSSTVILCPLA